MDALSDGILIRHIIVWHLPLLGTIADRSDWWIGKTITY